MSMRTCLIAGFSSLVLGSSAFAGNVAVIGQTGIYNGAFTQQLGRNNTSLTFQNGFSNGAVAVQSGRNNAAGVSQSGYYNGASVYQYGPRPTSMP